jgi:hypothetical protein
MLNWLEYFIRKTPDIVGPIARQKAEQQEK